MRNSSLKDRTLDGVLLAITAIATVLVRIPTPVTGGYVNLGDAVILACALLLGAGRGALIGGLGSALADLYAYPHFALATLVVKGLEGFLCGLAGRDLNGRGSLVLRLAGAVLGAAVMVGGYYGYEWLLMGQAKAIASLVPNVVQGALGVFIGLLLHRALRRLSPPARS